MHPDGRIKLASFGKAMANHKKWISTTQTDKIE
jgi:hypothetical protein